MQDIMAVSDNTKLTKLVNAFNGTNRIWAIKYQIDGMLYYSERFRIKNANDLLEQVKVYGSLNTVEINFSVGVFNENNVRIGWTMVFDVDKRGCIECPHKHKNIETGGKCEFFLNKNEKECLKLKPWNKSEACTRLGCLLDDFNVFWLMDKRKHFWIPDWETVLVKNWRDLCNREDATKIVSYLERVLNFKEYNAKIDIALLGSDKHLIRSPLSFHIPTKTFQDFEFPTPESLSDDERVDHQTLLWNGILLDKKVIEYSKEAVKINIDESTYDFAKNFRKFIEVVLVSGNEIKMVTSIFKRNFFDLSKRKDVRICLKNVPYGADHQQRLAILFELVNCGYSDDEIVELFKNTNDFKDSVTRYYIAHARARNYKRYSCKSLINMGLCLKDICPLFGKRS